MKNSKTRFSETSGNYDLYRPSYPRKLVDWIIKTSKIKSSGIIVDIGCGTGISTRLFDKRGFTVIGLDPNKEMLSYAISHGGNVLYGLGTAEKTGLKKQSVDLITVAQAFHWFNVKNVMKEFKKVLKPQGSVCAFWNIRVMSPFMEDYQKIVDKFCVDYPRTKKASETIPEIKSFSGIKYFKEASFPYFQKFNLEELIGRAYSTSYVVHGVKDHDEFKKSLKKIFDKHQKKGKVEFIYKTVAALWKFS